MGNIQSLYLVPNQGRQLLEPEIPLPAVLAYKYFSVILNFTFLAYCNFFKLINMDF